MTPEDEVESLLAEEGPNEPAKIPGGVGLSGPRQHVDPETARRRRATMSGALRDGASHDQILKTFVNQFGMTEQQIIELKREVKNIWAQEDQEANEIARSATRRRLLKHIAEASKDRKWTAVGNLEKVLADVEGTVAPEPADNSDARMQEALMSVLGELALSDPAKVRSLIDSQRTFIDTIGETIDATPIKAKSKLHADRTG